MNIVVLAAGTSSERAISVVSGTEVCKALRKGGHRAVLIDVFTGNEAIDMNDPFPEEYDLDRSVEIIHSYDSRIEELENEPGRPFFGPGVIDMCKSADIVFMALHGANGEDGRVQAVFDTLGIKYTGSGYLGSALAMSKDMTRTIFMKAGVPVPGGVSFTKYDEYPDPESMGLSYPLVVKPDCGGSSVGVNIVSNDTEYAAALTESFALEDRVIVEKYIKGREFSVGVIGGKALPVIELDPIEGFYDYKNKYTAGSTIETCPAEISASVTERMQKLAEEGYAALGIESYGRLDFIMNDEEEIFCLEANTLPGMTPTSLLPQEAAVNGMDFTKLCDELINESLKKYNENGSER